MARWPRGGLRWSRSESPEIVDPTEADNADAEARARRDALRPDPSAISTIGDAPFARLPDPLTLFQARAARFDSLAEGHPLGSYLHFLADLARLQHQLLPTLPAIQPNQAHALRLEHAMPPLTAEDLQTDPAFLTTLHALLHAAASLDAPAESLAAAARLAALPPEEQLVLATDVLAGAYPADQLGECLFAAAALQLHLARAAATLEATALQPVADSACPACGSAPVASLVVGWTRAEKSRYCACPLCATQWHHVRVKCTACSGTAGILYHTIAELSENVAVETCNTCHVYIKHMQQHADPALDPVADDIATYGLDLLIREEGFRRAGINPLFVQA